ncbi:pyrophosphatase PpaX [Cohnella sp. CFH 77786]|uniref:pyrophosphatase PpaX n=1 Tax=Cohnella sp. CFH 77786 TaxID=2662265 RepID=UPI001C60A7E6|nr:pyrophosphatase PpaX [Cohnella sp. CFH 77786]MBW5448994.1 pyrophosphatase PpaX [Cohnella sp. CFH 77786]
MTNALKAVLFDLDGTIVDTNELIIQSFLHALKGKVPEGFGRDHIIPSMGQPLKDQLQQFSGLEDVAELTQAYREYNYLKHDEMVSLFPGVAEVVKRLKEHGIKLGVVTTKMRPTTERALRMFGLFEHMDTIVTLDDVEHAKPHPEPVLKAMEAIGAEPEATAMVGDSTVDMQSALRAGAMPIGVAWSLKGEAVLWDAGAEQVIERMEELLALCGIEGAKA